MQKEGQEKTQTKEEVLVAILLNKRNSLLQELVNLSVIEHQVNKKLDELPSKKGKLKDIKADKKNLDEQSASIKSSYKAITSDMEHIDALLEDVTVLLG